MLVANVLLVKEDQRISRKERKVDKKQSDLNMQGAGLKPALFGLRRCCVVPEVLPKPSKLSTILA
jgi:hypothetical protein